MSGQGNSDSVVEFTYNTEQWNKFFETCKKLAPEVGQNAFNAAIRSGAKKIEARVKANINTMSSTMQGDTVYHRKRTGRLIKSIKIKHVRKYNPYFWKAFIYSDPGKTRNDPEGAFYAHFVEFGHRLFMNGKDTGRMIPPRPFLKRGLEQSEGEVIAMFSQEASAALEKAWKRLPKAVRGNAKWEDFQ